MSRLLTPGLYQDRSVDGVMWLFHCLSWSSFCRLLMIYGWHVFVVQNTNGLGNVSSLVGTCTSIPKRFLRGQRRMMREVWTCEVDDSMTSGSGRCRVRSSALKG